MEMAMRMEMEMGIGMAMVQFLCDTRCAIEGPVWCHVIHRRYMFLTTLALIMDELHERIYSAMGMGMGMGMGMVMVMVMRTREDE